MLFNSYAFVCFFLPATLLIFWLLERHGKAAQIAWLTLASFAFYAAWDWRFVPLLAGSILFNYALGVYLANGRQARPWSARAPYVLAGGIAANLLVLGFFKYYGFLTANLATVTGADFLRLDLILPLGISFFTFTQIAFLVDAHRGEAREYRLVNYALFVTYFPHLIAGPLLHHKEMMPQFAEPSDAARKLDDVALGLTIFIIGLAKKVLIADVVADDADRMFASDASRLTLIEAWAGTLAYTLQLYFDFSGYSDMAIGLSKMFGIDLPLNFNSPYKAGNIIEFWRRWHMTLSRFLREYLYIPLGGNRHGPARRYLNLMITMLLGGLWHGAGWTFVIWGALHGLYLVINHAWLALRARLGIGSSGSTWWSRTLAVATTFLAVVVAWVFFRADSAAAALDILRAMAGLNGAPLPQQWIAKAGPVGQWLTAHGMPEANLITFRGTGQVALIAALLAAVWLFPNTQEITGYLVRQRPQNWIKLVLWRPSPAWAVVCGVTAAACLYMMAQPTRFLYFQF